MKLKKVFLWPFPPRGWGYVLNP